MYHHTRSTVANYSQLGGSIVANYAQLGAADYSTMNPHQRSTQPRWEPFPVGALGAVTSPVMAAYQASKPRPAVNGLGQTMNMGTYGGLAVIAAAMAITGALSFQAGKAMSPNKASRTTWGWIGVPVGLFTGPLGLGVMGVMSNAQKK